MKEHTVSTTLINQLLFIGILSLFFTSGCAGPSGRTGASNSGTNARLIPTDKGICRDTRTGKMWLTKTSRTIKSLQDAEQYADTMKKGGYDDWRLPTVAELYDLYIIFDLHKNGACTMKVEGNYWSNEPDTAGRVGAWELDDNCDPERQYIPKKKGLARLIRP